MTITFDLLDLFQENKVLQIAQTMENVLISNTNGSYVTMETVTFLVLIIQILFLKQNFS